MEDPEVDDITTEELIPEAIKGDEKALRLLLFSTWMSNLLNDVSGRVSQRFKVDAEEVRDFVFEKVRLDLHKITNPNYRPWPDCLTAWCYKVAERYALNLIRHRGVAEDYRESVTQENTQRIEHGQRVVARYVPAIDQSDKDDEFFNAAQQERLTELMRLRQARTLSPKERQELESLVEAELDGARLRAEAESRRRKISSIVSGIISELAPEERAIISLWADGLSLGEIADKTDAPVTTVARRLKKIQRRLVEGLPQELEKLTSDEKSFSRVLKNLISDGAFMPRPHEFRA